MFTNFQEGKNALFNIVSKYKLCQKLAGLQETDTACFSYSLKECDGACIGEITPDEYNLRVQQYIDDTLFDNKSMMVIDRGRTINERSAVLIEDGVYKGYAFYDLNYQIRNIDILRNIIVPMQHNRDTRTILQNHLRKNKLVKVITF